MKQLSSTIEMVGFKCYKPFADRIRKVSKIGKCSPSIALRLMVQLGYDFLRTNDMLESDVLEKNWQQAELLFQKEAFPSLDISPLLKRVREKYDGELKTRRSPNAENKGRGPGRPPKLDKKKSTLISKKKLLKKGK